MSNDHDLMVRAWKENALCEEDADFRFLRRLKLADNPGRIDSLAHELHDETFAKIDCTRCANCCKTIRPGFTGEDVERIAAHLEMSPQAFIAAHLEADPPEGEYFTKQTPCPFLGEDDRCTIYDVRPEACRDYPHTNKEGFTHRIYSHSANELTCPAVYHIVKDLRRRLRRR
ncbi:MAG TPA: YkgJ family cysteine cluster protein [Armatimonadota bacterium]|nr:YkgJ family cysteine cluster protein [Armatimonadota bacterium]